MKLERYYDLGCNKCGRHRSTDFFKGFERSAPFLRAMAKKEGWRTDKVTGNTLCPICAKQGNDSNDTGDC